MKLHLTFLFTSKLADLLQPNSVQKFTIGAEVQVVYTNGAKKRDVFQAAASTENVAFASDTTIEAEKTPTGSAYHIIASFMFLIIALLF